MESGRAVRLANAVLQEFKHKVGGVHLPASTVARRFTEARVGCHVEDHSRPSLPSHRPDSSGALGVCGDGDGARKDPPDTFIAFAQSGLMEYSR